MMTKNQQEKNKCSYCKKEFPGKDLILFWDNAGNWHYCGGNWRPRHRRRSFWSRRYKKPRHDCCADFSNHPLFLCEPCYQAYKGRKAWTIQQQVRQHKEVAWNTTVLVSGIGIILLGLTIFWLVRKKRK